MGATILPIVIPLDGRAGLHGIDQVQDHRAEVVNRDRKLKIVDYHKG